MEEQAQRTQALPLEGMPAAEQQQDQEQHLKTIAIRVEEGLHAQLRFIAQLNDSSITEEIRRAIETRIATAQDDPELVARAQQARGEIEREAAARSAAIAGFLGKPAITATVEQAEPAPRGRRTSKTTNE
jgi:hypothetical protein